MITFVNYFINGTSFYKIGCGSVVTGRVDRKSAYSAGLDKTEGNTGPVAFNSSKAIEFSNDDPDTFNEQEGAGLGILRRFDFGLNATAGFELNGLLLSANYGYGLTKINSTAANDDDKNKHRIFSFSIGFRL